MSVYLMIVDGGTTNTRFTLMKNEAILSRAKKSVGAADGREAMQHAAAETIREFEAENNCQIAAIMASGMITSASGLKEIHHLNAPVSFHDLASHTKPCIIDAVSEDISFYFVPGVKFNADSGDLYAMDVMRGEETEIFAAVSPADVDKNILFIHSGSHNKGVLYTNRAISKSVTTLSGELFWAVCNNTILRSSVGDLSGFTLEEAFVKKGCDACKTQGFTRAMFLTRIGSILENFTHAQALSFLCGCLCWSDLEAFAPLFKENIDKVVVYGRDYFVEALTIVLRVYNPVISQKVSVIDFFDSENLSLKGLTMIYRQIMSE